MSNPQFSVVIPTFNRLSLCQAALSSVLGQTFLDFEIIIVDDGSTDGTQEFFNSYLNPKVTYLFQENEGVSTARNKGVEKSEGKYICYLDSDDIWMENKLSEIHMFIVENPSVDFIFHDFRKHDIRKPKPYSSTNSDLFPYIYEYFRESTVSDYWSTSSGKAFELVMRGYPFYPSAIIVKREVHQQYLWDPGILKSEDFNLVVKLALRYSFGYLDRCLTIVKVHDNNKSADSVTKDIIILNTMKAIRDLYCSGVTKDVANSYIAVRQYSNAISHLKKKNVLTGISWLLMALTSPVFYRTKFRRFIR